MMLAMMVGNSQLLNGDGEEKLGTSINDVKCNDEEVLEAVMNFLKLKEDAESPIAREEARKRTAQQKRADFHHSPELMLPSLLIWISLRSPVMVMNPHVLHLQHSHFNLTTSHSLSSFLGISINPEHLSEQSSKCTAFIFLRRKFACSSTSVEWRVGG